MRRTERREAALGNQVLRRSDAHMPLWLAAVLVAVLIGGVSALAVLAARREKNRAWLIAGACVLGALLLAFAGYIALTLLFLAAIP